MPDEDDQRDNPYKPPALASFAAERRDAFCSFCRRSYRDVGPLVEGPGEVFICQECAELCLQIVVTHRRKGFRQHFAFYGWVLLFVAGLTLLTVAFFWFNSFTLAVSMLGLVLFIVAAMNLSDYVWAWMWRRQ